MSSQLLQGIRQGVNSRAPSTVLRPFSEKASAPDRTASAKLFEDAVDEERRGAASSSSSQVVSRITEKNWDGDESMEDAVLRMLVDKYKPLRSGTVISADERLKDEARKITNFPGGVERALSLGDLPAIPMPSFGTASGSKGKGKPATDPDDAKARADSRRIRKLNEGAGRLGSAREKSLDYRFGRILGSQEDSPSTNLGAEPVKRANPVSLGGWSAMVEDAIEKARTAGAFEKVEGRGKPLKQYSDEGNPFIGREEFLMNRIIRRGGAAPPWVEVQGELESHIRIFRRVLRESWIRRAVRNILLQHPYSKVVPNLTVEAVKRMRDPEWESRERSYHDTALEEVNSQIRRHNGLAPFPARRGYLMRQYELERCYEDSSLEIIRTVEERLASGDALGPSDSISRDGMGNIDTQSLGIWKALRNLVMRLMPTPARSSPIPGDTPPGHQPRAT